MLHVSPATRILNENPDIESNILPRAITIIQLKLKLTSLLYPSNFILNLRKKEERN